MMANRLAQETSPYLQQHAGNPVDWYPWGAEALERARREDKPILLSVGYSACHWCHVMAQESFDDPGVAARMNELFVNIKVDREERPDIDQIYQLAHQMLSQRPGGWPLTMFLAPDGTPFFGGTYFPREARYGLPAFAELCARVAEVWRERRPEIDSQAAGLLEAFARTQPRPGAGAVELSSAPVDALLEQLQASFDARYGGFGVAPKFPHPSDLELCLRRGAPEIAHTTLTRMCEGGIYDQLGGGFCRYSVDAQWAIPHFEKMLYDNGPLLGLLADAWLLKRESLYERCADETAAWLMREMQSAEGAYYSSLDADSEHEEGKFYVWDRDEVRRLLEDEEYLAASRRYGLDRPANFEGVHWHLVVAQPQTPGAEPLLASARRKLLAARELRVRPGRDEKVLVSWNALAIRGMARAARVFGRSSWRDSARRALAFIRQHMWHGGRLHATYKDGRSHLNAYLDDYAFLLAAIIELAQADFSPPDLDFATELADVLLGEFEDREGGGFFFTGHEHEKLIHRPKPGQDNATPSGNAMAAWALGRLGALTGEERYFRAAERTLKLFYPAMLERPGGYATMALALEEALAPPKLLVLRGQPTPLASWQAALSQEYLPDTTVLAVPDGLSRLPAPLDKPQRPEPVNGWLCRGVSCLPPISNLVNLIRTSKEPS